MHANKKCHFYTFSVIQELKEQLAKSDEQIKRMNNLLFDILKQQSDANAQARLQNVWSQNQGNI